MDVCELKKAIERSGLTEAEIAKELGLSLGVFKRRSRLNGFGLMEARAMIELLGIENPDEFFFDT